MNGKTAKEAAIGPVVAIIACGEGDAGLVDEAASIAEGRGASLECLVVETGGGMSDEDEERLSQCQDRARAKGALVVNEAGADFLEAVLRYASRRGAQAIVLRAEKRRPFARSAAERLSAGLPHASVISVGISGDAKAGSPGARLRLEPFAGGALQFAAALLIVALVTGINLLLTGYVGYWAAAIPYLAAVSLSALSLDWPAVLFAAVLSALAWDYLFIPPRFLLEISRPEDVLMLGLYLLLALCSGLATSKLRSSERLLASREARLARLHALASSLVGVRGKGMIAARSMEAIEEAIGAQAVIILRDQSGALDVEAVSGWEPLDAHARAAAATCFQEGRATGRFSAQREGSEWHFLPLESPSGRLGVFGVRAAQGRTWDESTESYLKTAVSTVAIALARELQGPQSSA
jgi:two-component system sensor histidine kinase KdpD